MTSNAQQTIAESRKLVLVGDGMCGKTCLLFALKGDDFDPTHPPTVFDAYATEIKVDDKIMTLALHDTPGVDVYDHLRPFSYPDTNVVLICFSAVSPISAANVIDGWKPEIQLHCDTCPVILVACKIDLRTDPDINAELKKLGKEPVSNEDGKRIATQIKADAYLECSAKTHEGVQELILHAARLSLQKRTHDKSSHKCVLH